MANKVFQEGHSVEVLQLLDCYIQGGHSAAKAIAAVKLFDFERKAAKALKLYMFSTIRLQKLL